MSVSRVLFQRCSKRCVGSGNRLDGAHEAVVDGAEGFESLLVGSSGQGLYAGIPEGEAQGEEPQKTGSTREQAEENETGAYGQVNLS